MMKIIGRADEQKILKDMLKSAKSEFLALYGRRRVGKTFLIRNFFSKQNCMFFYATGIKKGKLNEQIGKFTTHIGDVFYNGATLAVRKKWSDTLEDLNKAIMNQPKNKSIILFFDEFPWMVTRKSGLLQAVDYYWNRYWSQDKRVKLIICGSSASWIIENIINNKDGLYNRITRLIELMPFSLPEVKGFLQSKKIKANNKQILDLYMVFGGIPHYLEQIEKGWSVQQAVDNLCFKKGGKLFSEFDKLFSSLFDDSEEYLHLIKIIAKHWYGIGQADLIKKSKATSGGRIVKRLKILEEAGFITSFIPYQHKEKGVYYKVTDEYTLFYLKWILPNLRTLKKLDKSRGYWQSKANLATWLTWSGYAFESICYKHIIQIRNKLDISAGAEVAAWRFIPRAGDSENGAQIDLLFDRGDDAITICEIKNSIKPFAIDKQYAKNLLNKVEVFKKHIKTKKQIFIAMISVMGLKETMYSEELISGIVTLEDLFKEI